MAVIAEIDTSEGVILISIKNNNSLPYNCLINKTIDWHSEVLITGMYCICNGQIGTGYQPEDSHPNMNYVIL